MKRFSPYWLLLAISIIILDLVTKYISHKYITPAEPLSLLPVLQLVNVRNKGAAFGMMSGMGNVFFILVSIAAMAFVVYLFLKGRESRLSLCLIFSGAVGNLVDRLSLGYVRDFIDFYISKYHWPAFNVADSALTIGLGLLLLGSLKKRH